MQLWLFFFLGLRVWTEMQIKKPDGKSVFILEARVESASVFEMLVWFHTCCYIHTISGCGYGCVLPFTHLVTHFDLLLKS